MAGFFSGLSSRGQQLLAGNKARPGFGTSGTKAQDFGTTSVVDPNDPLGASNRDLNLFLAGSPAAQVGRQPSGPFSESNAASEAQAQQNFSQQFRLEREAEARSLGLPAPAVPSNIVFRAGGPFAPGTPSGSFPVGGPFNETAPATGTVPAGVAPTPGSTGGLFQGLGNFFGGGALGGIGRGFNQNNQGAFNFGGQNNQGGIGGGAGGIFQSFFSGLSPEQSQQLIAILQQR